MSRISYMRVLAVAYLMYVVMPATKTDVAIVTLPEKDVSEDGRCNKTSGDGAITVTADHVSAQAFWKKLQQPPPNGARIRAIFVENLSLHVLQMLGTTYRIEPSFYSSLINWIPLRYREDNGHEDHITVVLPFIYTMQKPDANPSLGVSSNEAQDIDPQAPLDLIDEIVFQDLLAIHMVHSRTYSTIISCHPMSNLERVSGERLQSFAQRTWDNTHQSETFMNAKDPTPYFFDILCYALYAWEEALAVVCRYVDSLESGFLETGTIHSLACKNHKVQAHLLYYERLLLEFHASIEFVKQIPNTMMEAETEPEESAELMKSKADKVLCEISRLWCKLTSQFDRLQNVTRLTFATTNIEESKALRRLAEDSLRGSAHIKLLAYVVMIYLPGILMAKVFGMNVVEFINLSSRETLRYFAGATVALTSVTAWVVITLQPDSSLWPYGSPLWRRLAWPIFYIAACIKHACLKHRYY